MVLFKRKNPSSSWTMKKKRKTVKSTTDKPARFRYSKRTFRKNVAVSNMLNKFSERKISPMLKVDEGLPGPIQLGSQCYYWGACTGVNPPPGWSALPQPLEGFDFPSGTAGNERIGRFMYLDHSTGTIQVEYNAQNDNQNPVKFRCIVFKARRGTDPVGLTYNPAADLFLRPDGGTFGHGSSGIRFTDIELQPLNKKDFIIYKDVKFILSPTIRAGTAETAAINRYPNTKTIKLYLPHKIKCEFRDEGNFEPHNYDYRFGILIYAGEVGRDGLASGWEVNFRGSTCAFDN